MSSPADFVPPDADKALEWYRKAAERPSKHQPMRQCRVGRILLTGRHDVGQNVRKDEAAAAHWMRLAADGGGETLAAAGDV